VHAMLAAFSVVLQDVPPYVTVQGYPAKPHGTNSEGLRRRGFAADAILRIRRAYKAIYRENLSLDEARAKIVAAAADAPELLPLAEFLAASDRGLAR
ncbi:MAG: acyl-[acyl-carrier-protein]--UDP-N-acetylglucosamine O-acyltransferase, partial [Burkholderiales bacterium]|nr:acyl-[acyl-carrier-protein]--UDP-N-acetylglucosamine O-acyltransferase [Burkholderiales bacterium]